MSPYAASKLELAVDRGLEIYSEIEKLKKELGEIEEHLELAALTNEQVDLVDPEREGKQYIAHGSAATVPVVLTSDLLRKSFPDGSVIHQDIESAACEKLREFYTPVTTWEIRYDSGKIFRRVVLDVLGESGPAFITACVARDKKGIAKSAIKVEWKRAEKKEAA